MIWFQECSTKVTYKAIVMGASAGGLEVYRDILGSLSEDFPLPIVIAQHLSQHEDSYLPEYLDRICNLKVKEALDKDPIMPGMIYVSPPGYHILVDEGEKIALSVEERVNFSRPSIDLLFESASDVYGMDLVGILLTGANRDGAKGLRKIHLNKGLCIVQSPETAVAPEMPEAALKITDVDYIMTVDQIIKFMISKWGS